MIQAKIVMNCDPECCFNLVDTDICSLGQSLRAFIAGCYIDIAFYSSRFAGACYSDLLLGGVPTMSGVENAMGGVLNFLRLRNRKPYPSTGSPIDDGDGHGESICLRKASSHDGSMGCFGLSGHRDVNAGSPCQDS